MRIGITGVAGFIGAHLARRLLAEGHRVVGWDNLYTGTEANLDWIGPGLEFHEHDVREPFSALGCELLFHLACPASPPHYQRDPIFTWETALLGSRNAYRAALAAGIPIVVASTSEVYGDPQEHPQHERYWGHVNPVGLRSCYDEGKRAAETLAADMRRRHGLDVRIARIFNTYGPRMAFDDGRVVSNFLVQALTGRPLTIYGDGSQTRSFCYVDDLVDGLLRLARHSGPVPEPVNLGNPEEHTILELAELVAEVVGRPVERHFRELPSDDPVRRRPDITRARTLLDWRPRVSLREGLQRTAEAFAARLAEAPPP